MLGCMTKEVGAGTTCTKTREWSARAPHCISCCTQKSEGNKQQNEGEAATSTLQEAQATLDGLRRCPRSSKPLLILSHSFSLHFRLYCGQTGLFCFSLVSPQAPCGPFYGAINDAVCRDLEALQMKYQETEALVHANDARLRVTACTRCCRPLVAE